MKQLDWRIFLLQRKETCAETLLRQLPQRAHSSMPQGDDLPFIAHPVVRQQQSHLANWLGPCLQSGVLAIELIVAFIGATRSLIEVCWSEFSLVLIQFY